MIGPRPGQPRHRGIRDGENLFLFLKSSRPAEGPTCPPILMRTGGRDLHGIKRPGRETDH